ncbi:MAG: cytochrome c oxidase subunit II [Candidatus Competibacteraceae bacterium]|nr:cytochrome c oxidase subunit II [Candidatus Competibacteraceae bacterium]
MLRRPALLPLLCPLALAGCAVIKSTLDPAGPAAAELAELWWVMAAGAVLIYGLVIGVAIYATRIDPGRHGPKSEYLLILGGGVFLPVVVLTTLVVYSFTLGPELKRELGPEALRIEVVGEQWWWRVRYLPPGGEPVVSANELRLPVGRPVELLLSSPDVIHSLWVPRLAGKTDMIPGRVNRMILEASEPGVFRGQCAEYCGGPHALMAFYTLALPPEEFQAWLAHEAENAAKPDQSLLIQGQALFLDSGCGDCHTIRGTPADGQTGPDLTHVGSRYSLAAGILPNNIGTLAGWIAAAQEIKPGNKMPSFNTFSGLELRALAAYLESLE